MFGWFRRRKAAVPERQLRLEDLEYPFTFPVIAVSDDVVCLHESAATLALVGPRAIDGELPADRIHTHTGEVWVPRSIRAVCDTGRRLFGKTVYIADVEYELQGHYELRELQTSIADVIDRDPDDLWNQALPHDELLGLVRGADTFVALVRALQAASPA